MNEKRGQELVLAQMLELRLPWLRSIRFAYDKLAARGWTYLTAVWQVEEVVVEVEMVLVPVEVIAKR